MDTFPDCCLRSFESLHLVQIGEGYGGLISLIFGCDILEREGKGMARRREVDGYCTGRIDSA